MNHCCTDTIAIFGLIVCAEALNRRDRFCPWSDKKRLIAQLASSWSLLPVVELIRSL